MDYRDAIDWLYDLKHEIRYGEQSDAIDIAIECIGKQIPKLIKTNGKYMKDFGIEPCDQVFCPNCGKRIRVKYKGKFCDKCGQAIDWENE